MSRSLGFLQVIAQFEKSVIENPDSFFPESKLTLSKLVSFIEQASFTKSEVMKFVCKNFRKSTQELSKLLNGKSNNTVRSQVSVMNKFFSSLLGDAGDIVEALSFPFSDESIKAIYEKYSFQTIVFDDSIEMNAEDSSIIFDFYSENSEYFDAMKDICDILDAVALDFDVDFSSLIIKNLVDDINYKDSDHLKEYRSGLQSYNVSELQSEIAFLKTFSTKNLFTLEEGLDKEKLKYISYIMSKPLVGTDLKSINKDKVPLLLAFYSYSELPMQPVDALVEDDATVVLDKSKYSSENIEALKEEIDYEEPESIASLLGLLSAEDVLNRFEVYASTKPSDKVSYMTEAETKKFLNGLFKYYSPKYIEKSLTKINPTVLNSILSTTRLRAEKAKEKESNADVEE